MVPSKSEHSNYDCLFAKSNPRDASEQFAISNILGGTSQALFTVVQSTYIHSLVCELFSDMLLPGTDENFDRDDDQLQR